MTKRSLLIALAVTVPGLLGLLTSEAGACPIRTRVFVEKAVVVQKKVIVETPIAVAFYVVPLQAVVASYSTGYTPTPLVPLAPQQSYAQPAPAVADPCAQRMAVLQRQIDELRALVGPRRGGDPKSTAPMEKAPEASADPTGGWNVLYTRCASCHDADVAATKGSNFVIFQGGKMRDLTNRQTNKVLRMIRPESEGAKPKMPKDAAALSDEEVKKIEDLFNSQ